MLVVNMYELYTKPITRLFARISRHCTVVLTTGKEIEFNKSFHTGCISYNVSLTEKEEEELTHSMMLMGI